MDRGQRGDGGKRRVRKSQFSITTRGTQSRSRGEYDSATQTDAAHPNHISEGLHSELPGPQAPADAGGGQEHEGGSHPVQEHSNSPSL